MKKKNSRKENIMMDDLRIFGVCECCGNEITDEITDENRTYYVSDDGLVFCSTECVFEHYGVTIVEV
jgi:hypothetical protein